jgi:hypothetical protein
LNLPPDELLSRFLQHISSSNAPEKEPFADEIPLQADSQIIDLTVESTQPEGEAGFDPFSDIFPAHYHRDWGSLSTEAGQEMQNLTEKAGLPGISAVSDEEFSFDPPGDIVSSIPLHKTITPGTAAKESQAVQPGSSSERGGGTDSEKIPELKDIRLTDKESPHQLFASMNDEAPADTQFRQGGSDASPNSLENRLRLKGIQTQSSILKASSQEIVAGADTSGQGKTSPGTPGQSAARRASAQPASTHGAAGKISAKTVKAPRPLDSLSSGEDLHPGASFRDEYGRRSSLSNKVIYPLLLLALCLATYLLVRHWDDMSAIIFMGKEPVSVPEAPPRPSMAKLPPFIPAGIPDKSYGAAHPGWERYEAGGLEYLVFRDNGRIRAVQVIAGKEGKISDSYLGKCLRDTTGLDHGSNWVREQREDFLVEKGTLQNMGEVAVYRKMPEGEIRGFVITLI